ncbi:MAG: PIN domain-containing protein [Sphingobacteriales bacterium]|nr:PIN domain-containing protein [Sphingobacteriales bacterium]
MITGNAIYVSVISIRAFNAYPNISKTDIELFQLFLSRVQHIDLIHDDSDLLQQIIKIRKAQKIKLPDAIIAVSAMILEADLMTADKEFTKIKGLTTVNW